MHVVAKDLGLQETDGALGIYSKHDVTITKDICYFVVWSPEQLHIEEN